MSVPEWDAYAVLSRAKKQIMMSDLPHTLYDFKEKSGNKSGEKTYNPNDRAFELQRKADEAAAARKKERQKKEGYTVEELFRGEADKD